MYSLQHFKQDWTDAYKHELPVLTYLPSKYLQWSQFVQETGEVGTEFQLSSP